MWEFGGTGIKRNKGERKRWKSAVWWALPLGRGVFSKGSAWGLISGPWRRQQLLPALGTLFCYHQAWRMSFDSFNIFCLSWAVVNNTQMHTQSLQFWNVTHAFVRRSRAISYGLKSCSILSCLVYGPLPSCFSCTLAWGSAEEDKDSMWSVYTSSGLSSGTASFSTECLLEVTSAVSQWPEQPGPAAVIICN